MRRIFHLFILGTLVPLSSVAYSLWAFLTKNPRSFEIGLKLILIGIGVYLLSYQESSPLKTDPKRHHLVVLNRVCMATYYNRNIEVKAYGRLW